MLELKIEVVNNDKKLCTNKITLLKKTFETICDMTEEVDVVVEQEGIVIHAMDNMQIMYGDIFISKNVFSSFRCDRSLVLGIKPTIFLNVLKSIRLDNFKYFLITCGDDAKNLSMIIKSNDCTISRKLILFNFDKESFNISELDYDVSIKMPIKFFTFIQKILSDFSGDYLKFSSTKENLSLSIKGDSVSSKIDIKTEDSQSNVELECLEDTEKTIPIKFINCIAKCASLADDIYIKFSGDTPMFIDCNMSEYGFAKFYIAPKEEDEYDNDE